MIRLKLTSKISQFALTMGLCAISMQYAYANTAGFVTATNTACQVYLSNKVERTAKWQGNCSNGQAQGQGTAEVYNLDGSLLYTMSGVYQQGKLQGQGVLTWTNGDKYVGEYKDGLFHGQGTYTWANGHQYVGQWQNDKKHGQGTFTGLEGYKYVGQWQNDKKHGQGTATWADGRQYVGQWQNGNRHGQGTYTWAKGSYQYVGGWKDDEKYGEGVYTNPDFKYVGQYGGKDGVRIKGTYYWSDGSKLSCHSAQDCEKKYEVGLKNFYDSLLKAAESCDHVYVGKRFITKDGWGFNIEMKVEGVSTKTGIATVHRIGTDSYQEIHCSQVPK